MNDWTVILRKGAGRVSEFLPTSKARALRRASALLELHGPKTTETIDVSKRTIVIDASEYYTHTQPGEHTNAN